MPPFEQIYAKHFDFVWAMVRHYGVHPDYVADVVQDVFVVVHTKLHTLSHPESTRSWLHGIVRRVASGHRRKRYDHRLVFDVPLEPLAGTDTSLTPAEQAEHNERMRRLSAILQTIEPSKRRVFVMCELEEFTCPEIAELLHLPLNTVYSRLRRARETFEKALARNPEARLHVGAPKWSDDRRLPPVGTERVEID